ncbi:hypothetical protein C1646_766969 [Rhizophagus diaphanus]|nr:hypothetical protein C1646_766969 [Rhizophagus diaphanus] [Rhizophagus sp. MUCL 43196]
MANLDFDMMPAVGINIMVMGLTTQTVKNVDGESVYNGNFNGLLYYQESIVDPSTSEETTPAKHILKLDDISLISSNRPNTSAQSINLLWLNQESTNSRNTPQRLEANH